MNRNKKINRHASRVGLILVLFVLSVALTAPGAGAQQGAGETEVEGEAGRNKFVREGIAVEFQMEPVAPGKKEPQEGDLTTFRFEIMDTTSGMPLSGVYPAAWMDLRPLDEKSDAQTCQDKVEAFIGGSLFTPPELDLNVYYVLALNNDASISVVDPLFGFGTTKLLDMIFLESPGEDWVLMPDQLTLFVSMPDSNQVAVADTASWNVVANLDVGPRPSRVALQPDERFVWVGYDIPRDGSELSGVTVVDTQGPAVAKEILTGRGHHEIAFSDDDRYAFVTNEEDGTLSVIDIRKLEKIKDVAVGASPVSVAFSPTSQSAYVVSRADGTIVVVGSESHEVTARMKAEPGLGQLKFAPGSRLGFVVNTDKNVVHILDASVNRIVQTADVEDAPDQVAFSDELAYVRHRNTDIVLMIPLDQVGREGQPVPVIDFTGGQTPFGRGSKPSPADGIVQAPGATAVLVANPADKAIYFYKEGMAAPMGHFTNYGREPRAVLAVDRSLKERSPGSYETTAALRRPGLYDVAFFLDAPRTTHCFEVRVAPNPALEAERAKVRKTDVEPLTQERIVRVGEKIPLKFKLTDATTGRPRSRLEDVRVLTFRAPGVEQRRMWAKPSSEGEGIYEVEFEPQATGIYYVFLECKSVGLRRNRSGFITLQVKEGDSTTLVRGGSPE